MSTDDQNKFDATSQEAQNAAVNQALSRRAMLEEIRAKNAKEAAKDDKKDKKEAPSPQVTPSQPERWADTMRDHAIYAGDVERGFMILAYMIMDMAIASGRGGLEMSKHLTEESIKIALGKISPKDMPRHIAENLLWGSFKAGFDAADKWFTTESRPEEAHGHGGPAAAVAGAEAAAASQAQAAQSAAAAAPKGPGGPGH